MRLRSTRSYPEVPSLEADALTLAQIVAKNSFLPDPRTVVAMPGPLFPTLRSARRRFEVFTEGNLTGMYDDNTTPQWAFNWSHGLPSRPKAGWNIAHVWPSDLSSYTRLANLLLIPEALSRLTDKEYVLAAFLRWHAFNVYRWKPALEPEPIKPEGYDLIAWRYLEGVPDPAAYFKANCANCRDKRLKIIEESKLTSP